MAVHDSTYERILLASGSPRRRELLTQMGIHYDVRPPELDESSFDADDPVELVRNLAGAKAGAVRRSVAGAEDRWILAADTEVAVDGAILGKPHDRERADEMIRLLSGRTHLVVTGIAIWPPGAESPTIRVAETNVSFATFTEDEITRYLDSNDWEDVAGGYRIQGRAALHIERIEGSYSNVVGLPIHLVYSILTEHGYQGLG